MTFDITDIFWEIKEWVGNAKEGLEELVTGKSAKQNAKHAADSNKLMQEALRNATKQRDTANLKIEELKEKDTIKWNLMDAGTQIKEKVVEKAWEIKDKAMEVGWEIKDKAVETGEKIKDTAEDVAEEVVDGVDVVREYLIEKLWSESAAQEYLRNIPRWLLSWYPAGRKRT